jgi:hypothetical protein
VSPSDIEREIAERHVRDGEELVARQREIVDHLRTNGHPTKVAEGILLTFENQMVLRRHHLARLKKEAS